MGQQAISEEEKKKKFVAMVKECRELIACGKYSHCTCPNLKCEWHGNCFECVLLHRAYQDHIPNCMQPMLRKKVRELAALAELSTAPMPQSPPEMWDYINENFPKEK